MPRGHWSPGACENNQFVTVDIQRQQQQSPDGLVLSKEEPSPPSSSSVKLTFPTLTHWHTMRNGLAKITFLRHTLCVHVGMFPPRELVPDGTVVRIVSHKFHGRTSELELLGMMCLLLLLLCLAESPTVEPFDVFVVFVFSIQENLMRDENYVEP